MTYLVIGLALLILGGCGEKTSIRFVKHLVFPQEATLEQKVNMAAGSYEW